MKLQVTGKNLDVTDPIVDYAERKLTKLTKHLADETRVRAGARGRAEPVDRRQPGRGGDGLDEGARAAGT